MEMSNKATTKTHLEVTVAIWEQLNDINCNSFPQFLPNHYYKPWWSAKLTIRKKQVNAAKRKFKRSTNILLYLNKYTATYSGH